MSETESTEFKIVLDSVWHNDPPKFEVLLNEEVIENGFVIEKQENDQEKVISFTRDLQEGEYTLKIRLLGKLPKHTAIDENGNIIADQIINIKQIEIDEIELDHLFYLLSSYHKQTKFSLTNPQFDENPLPDNYINLGYNGEWRLKFTVPTYMWFLENL